MLTTRIISSLILGPLVLSAFIFGTQEFMVAWLMLLAGISIYEAVGILLPAFEHQIGEVALAEASKKSHLLKIRLFCFAMMVAIFGSHALWSTSGSFGVLVFVLLFTLAAGVLSAGDVKLAAGRSFGMFVALIYGTLPWMIVWELSLKAEHSAWILLVAGITWLNDIGGYFGGRFGGGKIFGTRKLAPSISPKKTWEGALTGMILGVIAAIIVNNSFNQSFGSTAMVVCMAVFGGVFSQVGDLVESTMKRFAGVKDSGRIIPGHGGFLDRVDGILFCAPMVWLIAFYGELMGL